jgi:hypothetical protein
MKENITPNKLKKQLELNQAKDWGYKSISLANKDGYDVTRNNCTLSEFKLAFNLSEVEARNILNEWKHNNKVNYTNCCGLDQIIFI